MAKRKPYKPGLAKGTNITVDPIRFPRHIFLIKQLLAKNPRNYLLFVLGINNGLRMKDLLQVKVGDVCDLEPGGYVAIRETKTGKTNFLVINKPVHKALQAYLAKANPAPGDYLFKSNKTGQALRSICAGRMVKEWCQTIGLQGNYGAHTLRKTWAYHMRKTFKTDWSLISTRLNHSNLAVTKRYLGVHQDEIVALCMNPVG